MKSALLTVAMITALTVPGCAEAVPEQTLSERVGQQLAERMDKRYDTDFTYEHFELNTLMAELLANNVGVATRIEALDEGLNQLLWAEHVKLEGDWLSQRKEQLTVERAEISNAQLTIAYYGKGRSNLHAVVEKMQQQLPLEKASQKVNWQVNAVVLEDVVVNLFDQGKPLLSVRLEQLELPKLHSQQNAQDWVNSLLGPLLDQLLAQAIRGEGETMTVDSSELMRFIWREMGAF